MCSLVVLLYQPTAALFAGEQSGSNGWEVHTKKDTVTENRCLKATFWHQSAAAISVSQLNAQK